MVDSFTRSRVFDLLQSYAFWLIDVSPSRRPPFLVLGGPAYGFSAISHPEVTVTTTPIEQYNQAYSRHAFQGASVGAVTLSRGSRIFDSSMWMWIDRYIRGEDVSHRDLMLIQHMTATATGLANANRLGGTLAAATSAEVLRLPGKIWMLWGCVPTAYKSGSGLDAKSGEISIAELTVQPTEFTEISADPTAVEY